MTEHKVPIQSLIDHIKTAVDVDPWAKEMVEELLKEQEKKKFFVDSDGKITPLPDIVRCKNCVHRGKAEKCVLAAITVDKGFLFMLDNHGEWYCADGKREAEEK